MNLESVIADYAADYVLRTVVAAHGASMTGHIQMIAAHDPALDLNIESVIADYAADSV